MPWSGPAVRVLFAGSPDVALPALSALLAGCHEVVGVLTRPDARAGRGRTLRGSPVAAAATAAGLPVLRPPRLAAPGVLDEIAALSPDCAAVVAYGALLPEAVLGLIPRGWINLHFSVLPRWRGAAPVQHALFAGDDQAGVTTFQIVRALDAGPVYTSVVTPIGATETAGELLERLAGSGAEVLAATLDAIAAGAEPTDQPAEGITLAPKVTSADAHIDWSADAVSLDRRVRGCTPAPGAWSVFRGQRVKLGPVRPVAAGGRDSPAHREGRPAQAHPTPAPGGIGVRSDPVRVEVATGSGPVVLSTVQLPGRAAVDAPAWARGARPAPGERFGP